jgi:hypothetical protein
MGEWIPQPRLVSFVAKSRRWLRFLSQWAVLLPYAWLDKWISKWLLPKLPPKLPLSMVVCLATLYWTIKHVNTKLSLTWKSQSVQLSPCVVRRHGDSFTSPEQPTKGESVTWRYSCPPLKHRWKLTLKVPRITLLISSEI